MDAAGTQTALWMSNLNLGVVDLKVSQLDSTNTHLASGVSSISVSTFNSWLKSSATDSYEGSFTDPAYMSYKSTNMCHTVDQYWQSVTEDCPEEDTYGNKYATIYNYAAATAGTHRYARGSGAGVAVTSDLCPSGWRMPTGGNTGELKATINAYNLYNGGTSYNDSNSLTFIQQSLRFPLAGGFIYTDSTLGGYGKEGIYWSSANNDGYGVYSLRFDSTTLYPAYNNYRNYAGSLRCIAQ